MQTSEGEEESRNAKMHYLNKICREKCKQKDCTDRTPKCKWRRKLIEINGARVFDDIRKKM